MSASSVPSPPDVTLVLYRPRWDEVADTLAGLAAIRDEFRQLQVLLSGSTQEQEQLRDLLAEAELTVATTVEHRHDNLGFASGHNRLMDRAFDTGASACLVLNPDVMITPGALRRFIAACAEVPGPALFGPVLRSEATGTPTTDSAGIAWTATGRHIDARQGQPWREPDDGTRVVDGVTGACLLVPRAAYDVLRRESGYVFDDFFLAYREDAELGVRARHVGVSSVLVEVDGFRHDRHVRGFERGKELPDMLGVQNRFLLRFALGRHRPGRFGLATLRDLSVICAVYARERTSIPGLRLAWRVRRAAARRGIVDGPTTP